jgi:putative N6-adenine-specific DNA methylase
LPPPDRADTADFEIFLVAVPGLEALLCTEAKELGFASPRMVAGGVAISGLWPDVWRANLHLRGASRVLARLGDFRVSHLAQLDKKARSFPWAGFLRRDMPVTVEASCRKSKIYHSGAAAERIATALREELGVAVTDSAEVVLKARIEKDICTLSVDTSGGLLHKRGSKLAMAKAPLRETMAALLLRACGFNEHEPVLDPFCGSGTFVIEAAEMAAGLLPGRNRAFAFERLASFDAKAWAAMRTATSYVKPALKFYGSDRDAGAISAAIANAERAGVPAFTEFERKSMSDAAPPAWPPGLVIMNPPYGTRIGEAKKLEALYATMGNVLRQRFLGWRVGLITSNDHLARTTGLPWDGKPLAFLHGGLKVKLWRSGPL